MWPKEATGSVSDGTDFFAQLRQRGVVRAALLYCAAAFAFLEFADIAFPRLGLPESAVSLVLWLGIAGFPVVLVAAWALEIRAQPDSGRMRTWLSPATLGAVAALIGLGVGMGYLWGESGSEGAERAAASRPSETDREATPFTGPAVIAVLPLENLSSDEGQEYFSDGLTEALITDLAKLGSLRVISRTSVMRFKRPQRPLPEIARELGADIVLEGSVLREDDQVRITAQLIDASNDHHIWAESYQSELRQILRLQAEIAREIATAVGQQVLVAARGDPGPAPEVEPRAYEAYLVGRSALLGGRAQSAREEFEAATRLDPGFAAAWAGLAESLLCPDCPALDEGSVARAAEASNRALDIDPRSGSAHRARALYLVYGARQPEAGEEEIRTALSLDPSDGEARALHATLLAARGRLDEALDELESAQSADPLGHPSLRGLLHALRGEPSDALEHWSRGIEFEDQRGSSLHYRAQLLCRDGRTEEGMADLRRARPHLPTYLHPDLDATAAFCLAHAERDAEAREILRTLEQLAASKGASPVSVAAVHVALEQTELAREWLQRAHARSGDPRIELDLRLSELEPRVPLVSDDYSLTNQREIARSSPAVAVNSRSGVTVESEPSDTPTCVGWPGPISTSPLRRMVERVTRS